MKSKLVTFLLCTFLGNFGVHRFYLGKVGTGLLYLFTFGFFGIGSFVDIIRIASDTLRDKMGRDLNKDVPSVIVWLVAGFYIFIAVIGFYGGLFSSTEDTNNSSIESNNEIITQDVINVEENNSVNKNNVVKDNEVSIDEYKSSCKVIPYIDIARNPNNYVGNKVTFTGKVVQVQESGKRVVLRVNVTKDEYGFWEDTIYIDYRRKTDNESRVLEEDIITIYGEVKGLKNYTAVLGNQISIPHIIAEYIEIN